MNTRALFLAGPLLALLSFPAVAVDASPPGKPVEGPEADAQAEEAVPDTTPAEPVLPPSPLTTPPAGSVEDQALWRAAREVNVEVPALWRAITTWRTNVIGDRLAPRLDTVAKSGPAELREPARKARTQLDTAMDGYTRATTLGRLVDQTRVCGYELLTFSTAMQATRTETERRQLSDARLALRICVEKARPMAERLSAAYAQCVPARKEADRVLALASASAGPSASPAAGAR